MTNTYNTGNPVGSIDARDLYDNASNFDEGMNSTSPSFTDRRGILRKSWNGMETEFNLAQSGRATEFDEFLADSAFVSLGNYASGIEVTSYSQYIAYDGNFWRPAPSSVPFTTSGTWVGADEDLFVLFNPDYALRQDLESDGGASLVGYGDKTVGETLYSILSSPAITVIYDIASLQEYEGSTGQACSVTSYYSAWASEYPYIGPRGGGTFLWDSESELDDDGVVVFAVTGVTVGRWIRQHTGSVSLWDAGCVTTPGTDNSARILSALYCGAGEVKVPGYQFNTTSLKLGTAANGVKFVGEGFDSCLSLIGLQSTAAGLLHIPIIGDAYGGTFAGAQNFTIDGIRLRGDEATGTVSTTGLVAYSAVNLQIGTIWTHGFYKSGMFIGGSPTRVNVLALYSYENGNQVGANTGGQGFAIAHDVTNYPAVNVEYAECWANGLSNFGTGLDLVRGNSTFGTLNFHDNGGSGMKVVTCNSAKIKNFIALRNNLHVGQTFSAFYTNGDFGEVIIDNFESDTPAGSGISIVNSGKLKIKNALLKNSPGLAIATNLGAGKVFTLEFGNLEVDTTASVGGINLPGTNGQLTFRAGKVTLRGVTGTGIIASCRHFSIEDLLALNNSSTVVFITGTPTTAYLGKVYSESAATSTVINIAAGVTNAVVLSARRSGSHASTLTDNGTTTYKPNVV